jgi:hypothetical protein
MVSPIGEHPEVRQEINLGLWLEDYRLACQASGADGDAFMAGASLA